MESRLSAILGLSILQPTFRTALSGDIIEPLSAVLYSVWRSVWRCYVQPTTRSALPGDITTDYPLYRLSALPCLAIYCTRLSDVLYFVCRFYSRLSNLPTILSDLYGILQMTICCALLCLAILQPTICGALLCLTSLQLTTRSALPVDITTDYPLCWSFPLSSWHWCSTSTRWKSCF
jgi:hypothetical protein